MTEKRTEPGDAVTFVVEVGPLVHYGFGKAGVARRERTTRKELDGLVRQFMSVGPRSKVVRTTERRDAA